MFLLFLVFVSYKNPSKNCSQCCFAACGAVYIYCPKQKVVLWAIFLQPFIYHLSEDSRPHVIIQMSRIVKTFG